MPRRKLIIEIELFTHDELVEITRREVQAYANYESPGGELRFLPDDTGKQYAVIFIHNLSPQPYLSRPHVSYVVMLAQVVGEKVHIIDDNTDKPLYEALMVNGKVPRQQIVLVYSHETEPVNEKIEE